MRNIERKTAPVFCLLQSLIGKPNYKTNCAIVINVDNEEARNMLHPMLDEKRTREDYREQTMEQRIGM